MCFFFRWIFIILEDIAIFVKEETLTGHSLVLFRLTYNATDGILIDVKKKQMWEEKKIKAKTDSAKEVKKVRQLKS